MSDLEKKILEEEPDFDNQYAILNEEKKFVIKSKFDIAIIICIFFLIILILYFAYSYFYVYHSSFYNSPVDTNNCKNVNVKNINNEDINIASNNSCIPEYNIDYFNNRKAIFNLDIYGDGSFLFNSVNQTEDGICTINCDINKDGYPDYNIDLDGDKIVDLNIIKEKNPSEYTCDLNCDINFDMIPDTNIDLNNDGVADINITKDNYKKAVYNVDYLGNLKATFNVLNKDGSVSNKVNDYDNFKCEENCDIDDDGHPDYNININDTILNQLKELGNKETLTYYHYIDSKCLIGLKECTKDIKNKNNSYVNIDINGDGIADVNILNDDETLLNEINKENKLNIDTDDDGFPNINIDIDNDGISDLNIIDNNKCVKNCDVNNDGKSDYLTNEKWNIYNINIDTDYDGICNINCDTNNDLIPDINIDANNDDEIDVNIDYDLDNVADFNIDTNNDYIADTNIDSYFLGVCNENCVGKELNNIKYENYDSINLLEYNDSDKTYNVNGLDIKNSSDNIYVLYIKNTNKYATKYKLYFSDIKNEYDSGIYYITQNGVKFIDDTNLPLENSDIKNNIIIKGNTTVKYVLHINLENSEDKNFSGKLLAKVVK